MLGQGEVLGMLVDLEAFLEPEGAAVVLPLAALVGFAQGRAEVAAPARGRELVRLEGRGIFL